MTDLDVNIKQLISAKQAHHYRIIPIMANGHEITFHISPEKLSTSPQKELELILNKKVILLSTSPNDIDTGLAKYYRLKAQSEPEEQNAISDQPDEVLQIIYKAHQDEASDIHFESEKNNGRLRYRIDGHLIDQKKIASQKFLAIVNQIKILSGLDIAEKRLPQDGRCELNYKGHLFNLRVSTLPTIHGEKIVLRILNKDASSLDISKLGFDNTQLEVYLKALKKPHGLILISGPTGSGKTTTLYASLKILNSSTKNILTIEDPVEYTLSGINQVQLKESIGLNFPRAMKTFLRQDPDIIMLGEIRDPETAQMAIRAALTGHLVLATIHTNSASGTINRLLDMGVPGFLLSGALQLSIAQRLVRLLCPQCKILESPDENIALKDQYKIADTYKSGSCNQCYHTGYSGRKAIYEIFKMNPEHKKQINQGLFEEPVLNGQSLAHQALELVKKGETSFEEIVSIITEN